MTDEKRTRITSGEMILREALTPKLLCSLCNGLMQIPIQTCRGELACENCYKMAISGCNSGVCPIDGEPIEPNQFFKDKFLQKEIDNLKCFCKNIDNGCPWEGTVGDLQHHDAVCGYSPIKCSFCREYISQTTINDHLETCTMFSLNGKCIVPGCLVKPVDMSDLKEHLREDVVTHEILTAMAISDAERKFKAQLHAEKKHLMEKQEALEDQLTELKDQISSFMKDMDENLKKQERNMSSLQERIKDLEGASSQVDKMAVSCENSSLLQNLSNNVDKMRKDLSDIDLRQQLSENTAYEGKLVWKIDNVAQRMNEAVTGKITALHSAPIFTSKYGYKFCGRMYLNGDGIGMGTHMSLFFVLMKSEYDALLSWPLHKKIRLRLMNQKEPFDNVEEIFISDVNSSSFKRPTKEMNVASGCPMFVSKEILTNGNFIVDDTLFVEISVIDYSRCDSTQIDDNNFPS